jgi:oligoendopeptidase F
MSFLGATMRHFLRLSRSLSLSALGLWLLAPATVANSAETAAATVSTDWDLTDLYPTLKDWQDNYARIQAAADKVGAYQGTLGNGAEAMLKALIAVSDLNRESARLYVYTSLASDQDVRVSANLERNQQARALLTRVAEKTSWIAPEVLHVGATKVNAYLAENATLKARFGHSLDNILRAAPHTLGLEAENILAATGDVLAQPVNVHGQLSDSELPVPTVTLGDGTKVRLTQPVYAKYRQSLVRADRKLVFDGYWGAWKKFEGTAGALLTTQVMGDLFTAKSRHFDTALQAAQFPDAMPEAVYRTLISEVNAALPTLYRYLRLRKEQLGISDDLHYYDGYPPMVHLDKQPKYSVAESERITLEALQPLGEEYLGLLRKGFGSRWMSAYPTEGKQLGAYMQGGAYDVHPYLLLNLNDDYESMSTLAHEWGHAVHSQLANRAQAFDNASYSTAIAESASIGNEMLLNDYVVAHAATREEKLFYLGAGLEAIRQTYFRQAMFAEFELAIHEALEQGKSLSGERMTEMYCGLLRKYSGEAQGVMKIDPEYCIEWAVVPHFYRNFYVYQYATSIAGAAQFTDAILKEGAPARARFLTLLRAGGSDYPYELYKRAGVDMASPAPYRALAARMNRLLDEFEALRAQK